MRYIVACLVTWCMAWAPVGAQGLSDEMKDTEEKLYASTKQINQFFRRFNGEEDESGKRFFAGEKDYRDTKLRKKYLPILFDKETGYVSNDLKEEFIKYVSDKKKPLFLDFHSSEWLAEVNTLFNFKGKTQSALLYMKIQAQGKGYEWVIDDVSFDPFKSKFKKDTSSNKKFIHPMSHELEFMTLRKAFEQGSPEQFTSRRYQPDYLTLFLYEMKQGNLKYSSVKDVKFHFFTIDGWYFELSNFNRPGYNTGWLISNLMKLENNQKRQMIDYIYDKN